MPRQTYDLVRLREDKNFLANQPTPTGNESELQLIRVYAFRILWEIIRSTRTTQDAQCLSLLGFTAGATINLLEKIDGLIEMEVNNTQRGQP